MRENFTKTLCTFKNKNFYLEDVTSWSYDDDVRRVSLKDKNKVDRHKGLWINTSNGMVHTGVFIKGSKSLAKDFSKIMSGYTTKELKDPKNKYLLGNRI